MLRVFMILVVCLLLMEWVVCSWHFVLQLAVWCQHFLLLQTASLVVFSSKAFFMSSFRMHCQQSLIKLYGGE